MRLAVYAAVPLKAARRDRPRHAGLPRRTAQVAAVFLECQAKSVDGRPFHRTASGDEVLDGLLRDIGAHPVIDAPPGEDHLGVVAESLGVVREVVGFDANAVPTDEARLELQ